MNDSPRPPREPAPRPAPPDRAPSEGERIEEASKESFPASDPPAWGPLHPGAPGDHDDHGDKADSESR